LKLLTALFSMWSIFMANLEFAALKGEYKILWDSAKVNVGHAPICQSIANKILANRATYENIERQTGVPWYWIGGVHSLESSLNFTRHLHNGDPLTARTRQVPAGRPATGSPPFTFEESAIDALKMPPHSLHLVKDWSIERILFEAERYNGWGYRLYHPNVKSPYLWSFTNQYRSGKYIADGKWSETHVSTQCGFAAIMKMLLPMIDAKPTVQISDGPMIVVDPDVAALQEALNSETGAGLVVDGDYGPKTRGKFFALDKSNVAKVLKGYSAARPKYK
jgi:lysozyme family protein